MSHVPEHLTAAAAELEALARELLPQVLELAERYERVSWEHCAVAWSLAYPGVPRDSDQEVPDEEEVDIDELPEGQALTEAMSVASALMDVMKLRLTEAHGDRTHPGQVEEVIGDRVPEYPRLFEAAEERDRGLVRMGRQLERGDLD